MDPAPDVRSLYDERLRAGAYRPRVDSWYYRVWDGFSMSPHRHDRTEIMLAVSGACTVRVGARSFRLQTGSLVLLDAGVPHSLHVTAGAPCRMMNLEFAFEPGAALLPIGAAAAASPVMARFLSPRRDARFLADAGDLHARIRAVIDLLDRPADDAATEAWGGEFEVQFVGLLLALARRFEEAEAAEDGLRTPVHVRRTLRFLRENYDRPIGLAEAAAAAGVSPGHLARQFRRATGTSVGESLARIRLEHACRLLAEGDLPVGAVAETSGFGGRHHFNAFFRARTGMTPGAYRARARDRSAFAPDADPKNMP